MRWPRRQREAIEPRPMVSRAMELETAKEILAEIFQVRAREVEEMIQRRLEERSWAAELSEKRRFWGSSKGYIIKNMLNLTEGIGVLSALKSQTLPYSLNTFYISWVH